MAYRYPVLARFMAAHWANESVHIVPVFGESGALLEHWVYCLFYNWPLTLKRRINKRAEKRKALKTRSWHLALCVLLTVGIFGAADAFFLQQTGSVPDLKQIWWLTLLVPFLCGAFVTWGFGGAAMRKRIVGAAVSGAAAAALSIAVTAGLSASGALAAADVSTNTIMANGIWRIFLFSIFSTLGALLTELKLKDPELRAAS
jgi:hypothetical protein